MITTRLHKILLVGAGPMAVEYAKVLKALRAQFLVVGRGKHSAMDFRGQTGIQPFVGGLGQWLARNKNKEVTDRAIVAVTENELGRATRDLIRAGVKSILVEKPGGLNSEDIKKVAKLANSRKAKVFVSYNRRFYSSALAARKIIQKAGGVSSFAFDFTERSYVVDKLKKAPGVKENWFLQNSSHVIDMAFFLGGQPKRINSFRSGKLKWHKPALFAGAGVSEKGALFSYHANWISAGRWGVEIMTSKNRLILRPLEKLFIQKFGSMEIEEMPLNDKFDKEFKPGLYLEVKSFLTDKKDLPTIEEQVRRFKHYKTIGGPKI